MKTVKMITVLAGPEISCQAGDTVRVDDVRADTLIAGGFAELVTEAAPTPAPDPEPIPDPDAEVGPEIIPEPAPAPVSMEDLLKEAAAEREAAIKEAFTGEP